MNVRFQGSGAIYQMKVTVPAEGLVQLHFPIPDGVEVTTGFEVLTEKVLCMEIILDMRLSTEKWRTEALSYQMMEAYMFRRYRLKRLSQNRNRSRLRWKR